jgi:hypothetical protein
MSTSVSKRRKSLTLAHRLREVREDLYGPRGSQNCFRDGIFRHSCAVALPVGQIRTSACGCTGTLRFTIRRVVRIIGVLSQ